MIGIQVPLVTNKSKFWGVETGNSEGIVNLKNQKWHIFSSANAVLDFLEKDDMSLRKQPLTNKCLELINHFNIRRVVEVDFLPRITLGSTSTNITFIKNANVKSNFEYPSLLLDGVFISTISSLKKQTMCGAIFTFDIPDVKCYFTPGSNIDTLEAARERMKKVISNIYVFSPYYRFIEDDINEYEYDYVLTKYFPQDIGTVGNQYHGAYFAPYDYGGLKYTSVDESIAPSSSNEYNGYIWSDLYPLGDHSPSIFIDNNYINYDGSVTDGYVKPIEDHRYDGSLPISTSYILVEGASSPNYIIKFNPTSYAVMS